MKNLDLKEYLTTQRSFSELMQAIPKSIFEKCSVVILSFMSVLIIFPDAWGNFLMPEFACLVEMVFYVIWAFFNGRRNPIKMLKSHPEAIFLSLLLLWSIISYFLANPQIELFSVCSQNTTFMSFFLFATIFFSASQIRTETGIRIVVFFFTITASLMSFFGMIGITYNVGFMETKMLDIEAGMFFNRNHYGYYLSMALPAALLLFMTCKKKLMWLLYGAELFLLSHALIKCRTTGSFIAVLIALAVFLVVFLFKFRKEWLKLILAFAVIVITIVLTARNTWDLGREGQKLIDDIKTFTQGVSGGEQVDKEQFDRIGSERGLLWRTSVELIKESPVVGFGPDNISDRLSAVGSKSPDPHNEFLYYGATLGIPAMLFYIIALGIVFIGGIRKIKSLTLLSTLLLVITMSYIISSFFGVMIIQIAPFFWMFLSFAAVSQGFSASGDY